MLCAEQVPVEDHRFIEPLVLKAQDFGWRAMFARLHRLRPDLLAVRRMKGRGSASLTLRACSEFRALLTSSGR